MMEWGGRVHFVQRLTSPLPLALIPNNNAPSSALISTLSSVFLLRIVYFYTSGLILDRRSPREAAILSSTALA